jgi:hypothetical protein
MKRFSVLQFFCKNHSSETCQLPYQHFLSIICLAVAKAKKFIFLTNMPIVRPTVIVRQLLLLHGIRAKLYNKLYVLVLYHCRQAKEV